MNPQASSGRAHRLYSGVMGKLARHAGARVFRLFARRLGGRDSAPEKHEFRLQPLAEPEVLSISRDSELNLSQPAVRAAYARGDICVGSFEGDYVLGYCWLAFAPLPHLDGVWVRFDRSVAWTYKSLVRPSHRGRGIAPALYRFADDLCTERSCTHSVICVESHNQPSVGAALTAGYSPAGYGAYMLRGSRLLAYSSAAAKGHGVLFFLPPTK